MKVNIVKYSQSLAQLFTMLTLGYSVKVKLVKKFTMYTFIPIGSSSPCSVFTNLIPALPHGILCS